MGLDMYLTARRFMFDFEENDKVLKDKVKTIFKEGLDPQTVIFRVYSWRKANAIHKWFVDNVQNGEDDCKTYYVSWKDLQNLLDTINKVLGEGVSDKEKVAYALENKGRYINPKFLPAQGGFFFGSTDYDEYYIQDLLDTKKMLEDLFKNKALYEKLEFEYSSSW